jgi:hypothetical protein
MREARVTTLHLVSDHLIMSKTKLFGRTLKVFNVVLGHESLQKICTIGARDHQIEQCEEERFRL